MGMRTSALLLLCSLGGGSLAPALSAQDAGAPFRTERVMYVNHEDSTYLTATLTLPPGAGPHPGVVLLSIAGVDSLVSRLIEAGLAVLVPVRRGFVAVEPLLQATYQDLAEDAQAAVDYMRDRPDVDEAAVSMIGQGDDSPAAMMAAAASPDPIPLVLLAPPGFPGREVFRLEQGGMAERRSFRRDAVRAVEELADRIAQIVLEEENPYFREYRLLELLATSEARLPYNAAFPTDESQVHFFASPLWKDRLAFEPEPVLARLKGPTLVLIGEEDLDTPMDAYLENVRRGLAQAAGADRAVCVVPERIRHSFSAAAIATVVGWVRGGSSDGGPAARPAGCSSIGATGR